ncbi:DUF4294 domain-containing protein [Mangrovimonas futianensis]|uniref:DUF4294 domain-containing protein n=1 Tax=Mangrovimonas futianensis TaxID=2895523 RepID=UPI001E3E572B|nr:DUF4294 domain-containing protein [Mangrovimonas futianensis]MCF1423053.1 DUF4294 domain-containing protein [Mangrovimonas futianensis]
MKKWPLICLFLPIWLHAQELSDDRDSEEVEYIIIQGDSIPRTAIDLEEVLLLQKLKFDSREDRRAYLILRRKTIKVYPYAKMASERLQTLNERLEMMTSKKDKRKYTKLIQKYLEEEFTEELKNLTRTEGQILVKLIHRQTGETTFELVKSLRSGWRAFWYNSTANLFSISLKEEFNPVDSKEDYYIEDILQRSFQNGVLEYQESALDFDYFELTNKWVKKATK